jgi:phosphatidate cytidylyltransferase
MKQRIITALLLAPCVIALLLYASVAATAAIIGGLCLIAVWEWTRLSGLRSRALRVLLVVLAALAMSTLWWCAALPVWWTLIGAGCAWWIAAIVWLRNFSFAASPTREHTVLKLAAGALTILPAWAGLMRILVTQDAPHTWALYSLLVVWAADSFAYLAGKRWGRTKLAPNISPGKTREGVYGALIGCAVIAAIGGWLLHVRGATLLLLVLFSLLTAAFSVIGDLFESLLKRHANVKDSGTLFPGHGGVCDRLDGVFAALPIFALSKALLGL